MALGRIPKSEGVGVLIGQGRQKRLALFCPRLENIRCGATLWSDARLKSVLIKIALSFHPALPPQNFLSTYYMPISLRKTAQKLHCFSVLTMIKHVLGFS